jgi:hypothetical protein
MMNSKYKKIYSIGFFLFWTDEINNYFQKYFYFLKEILRNFLIYLKNFFIIIYLVKFLKKNNIIFLVGFIFRINKSKIQKDKAKI